MSNHGCINGTLDIAKYSSPMPAIGLYIATASLCCMLFMIYDILAGFRARERWLPCKLFTLNSVTLTLLFIASKISVDITTAMPSPQDQLSKLTGAVFLCISIGFLWPSVGVNSNSECVTNIASVTIYILTVVVDTCIQISTGVIVLFIWQHILILCCMLVLLVMLWFSAWDISNRKRISTDENRGIFMKGDTTMSQKLNKSYLFGYSSSPQLILCLNPVYISVAVLCLMCSVILMHASAKTLLLKEFEFCSGVSDYDWSMPVILTSQIMTVGVGTFAITFRWISLFPLVVLNVADVVDKEVEEVIKKNPTLGIISPLDNVSRRFRTVYLKIVRIASMLIIIVPMMVLSGCLRHIYDIGEVTWDLWRTEKGLEDFNRWIEKSRRESPDNLRQLLSRTRPTHLSEIYVKASSLSIALLVRIAQVSLPDSMSVSLAKSYNEAEKVIHFIEQTINPRSLENDNRLLFAKAVWAGDGFGCLLDNILGTSKDDKDLSVLDRGLLIIIRLKNVLPSDFVGDELGIIIDVITRRKYSSIEDLGASIEQIVVDMLHVLLEQFPNAILKTLCDSTDEEYHERVKLSLNYFCKVEPLEAHIQWLLPAGCEMSGLI